MAKLTEAQAIVSRLPFRNGDGYSYGGEIVVTIGDQSFLLAASRRSEELATEIARRWNAGRAALEASNG